jgi:alkylation response protein AidB-like acyl-CoA dehydrogenase
MDLSLTEEQELIARTAREFSTRVLAPRAAERDRTGAFPLAELGELARLGFLGMTVPAALGGSEIGALASSLVLTEISAADPSVTVAVSVTNMVADLIARVGDDGLRRIYVPRLCSGEAVCGAFALSEPEMGSDPAALKTRATKVEGGWRLDGTKQWISHADHAGVIVTWAMSGAEPGARGVTCFLVPGGTPGVSVTRREEKMGLHGSSTCQLAFDGVFVPDDHVIGQVGGGFAIAMMALEGGRIGIGSQAVGIGRAALEGAVRYARDRRTFGTALIDHQAIGNMLADAATWLEAARLLTLRAAWRKDRGLSFAKEASMAKLFASEKAGLICDLALQIHGGYGYTRDFPIERLYRDVRVARIYEGTSEVQRIVIARHLLREAA